MNPHLKRKYFEIQNSKLGRCLYPLAECSNRPIKAHSVQNSRVLSLLEKDSHVVQLRNWMESDIPTLAFRHIGRNEASTFLGLCSEHDNLLFKPIDNNPIDCNNGYQLFLLAYRSVLKEYHASISAFIKTQRIYEEKVKLGYTPGDREDLDMIVIEKGCNAYDTHRYKEKFDNALRNEQFDYLKHIIVEIHNPPSIACSQLFSIDNVQYEDDVVRCVMNIFPFDQSKTLAIFTSTNGEFGSAKTYLDRCLTSDPHYAKYEISKMVIRNSENFFISPELFNKWSDKKQREIKDHFYRTMYADEDFDSQECYLF